MKVTHKKTSAEKLGEIISHMKWKQVVLAEVLGVGQKTMSFWLRGIKSPGTNNQKKIDIAYSMVMRGDLDGKPYANEFLKTEIDLVYVRVGGGKDKSTIKGNIARKKFRLGNILR